MDDCIYNVPISWMEYYSDRSIILRGTNLAGIADALQRSNHRNIVSIQIFSPGIEPASAIRDIASIPVDLHLMDVEREYPNLYQWAMLLEEGPARVTIPVVPGFGKAFKLAVSLGFPVKLEVTQPDAACICELREMLDLYLHRASISQPVEFFHSLLTAYFHRASDSLWAIQEEDPAVFRYVTEGGEETISHRFAGPSGVSNIETFLDRFVANLMKDGAECRDCEYLANCGGYFKWPNPAYRCQDIKAIFADIVIASEELQKDVQVLPPETSSKSHDR